MPMSRKSPKYPTSTRSIYYSILHPWLSLGKEFFFDGFHVKGMEKFPMDGPVMLVGNHQNAMLDPLVFCRIIPKQLHWLARSDVFRNPVAARFLYKINMLPIYREKDKVADQMERNEAVFSVCRTRLSKGAVIAMFPEGSHRGKKQLMTPLKKGFARLAFSSIEKDLNLMDLKIVPIGMDYSDFYSYHPRMILEVGEPIPVKQFWEEYLQDPNRAVNAMLKVTQESLSNLMVDIRDDDSYDMLIEMAPTIENVYTGDDFTKWNHYRSFCNGYQNVQDEEKAVLHKLWKSLAEAGRTSAEMEDYIQPGSWKWRLLWWVELIPGLLGMILFYPHYWVTEKFIKSKIQDELFYNSIRLASYTFLTPFYVPLLWLILFNSLTLTGHWSTHLWGIVFVLSLGMFAVSFNRLNNKRKRFEQWRNWSKRNVDTAKEILSLRKLWREIHEN